MPIIGSLLNNDWYKFTMPPVVRKHYPNTWVKCGFTNRNTDFPLARYVDQMELEEELEALTQLLLTKREVDFLRSLGVIDPHYLDRLTTYSMPKTMVERVGDQYNIWVDGVWDDVMPVEVPALQVVTELASRALAKEAGLGIRELRREGFARLDEAVEFFRANPGLKFAPFGTRRHFSVGWEYEATAYLVDRIPDQIAGISNVGLAMEFGYPLAGTIAHEYFMVSTMLAIAQGVPNPIGFAQNQAMDFWEAEYAGKWEGGMLCAIPDTFGTDSFLAHFTQERAELWRTFKQDSGDPKVVTEKILAWLRNHSLDARQYRINHTDGLTIATMADLHRFCGGRYMDGYGWGTRHTNNVGVATHSFVWKPLQVQVNGEWVWCVKLTDNLAKATGQPAMVEKVKQLVGYTNSYREVQTV
jgi:nicotinate phosphoribosyltransferase